MSVTSSMQAHSSMTLTKRKRRVDEYVKGGKKLSDWTIWVALETYLQVKENYCILHPAEEICLGHSGINIYLKLEVYTGKKCK